MTPLFSIRRAVAQSRYACLGRGHDPWSIRGDVFGRSATSPRGEYRTAATTPATAHVRRRAAIGRNHRLHRFLQCLDLSPTTHKPQARSCRRCRGARTDRSPWFSMQEDLTQGLLRQSAPEFARFPQQLISHPLCFWAAAALLPLNIYGGLCL